MRQRHYVHPGPLASDVYGTMAIPRKPCEVLQRVRADWFPQHMAGEEAKRADAWIKAPSTLNRAEAAEVLCALAACQRANRIMDKGDAPIAAARWSTSQVRAFQWLFSQQQGD